jgi:hypothetical protein
MTVEKTYNSGDRSGTLRKIVTGESDAQIVDRAGDTGDVEPDQLRLQRDPEQ